MLCAKQKKIPHVIMQGPSYLFTTYLFIYLLYYLLIYTRLSMYCFGLVLVPKCSFQVVRYHLIYVRLILHVCDCRRVFVSTGVFI